MSDGDFDLKTMTVEDLFRAKEERRQRQTELPFEEKIAIVKKLQSVSIAIRRRLSEDKPEQTTGDS
jgi:hypothetical protein